MAPVRCGPRRSRRPPREGAGGRALHCLHARPSSLNFHSNAAGPPSSWKVPLEEDLVPMRLMETPSPAAVPHSMPDNSPLPIYWSR